MQINNKHRDYPKWTEIIRSSFDDKFVSIFEKLTHQLTLLMGECPAKDLFNECMDVWAFQNPLQPVSALWTAIDRTYGINVDATAFKRKHPEIAASISDLKNILINVHFMVASQDVFDQLRNVPIQYN